MAARHTVGDGALLCLVCTEAVAPAEVRDTALCGLCTAAPLAHPTCKACMGDYFRNAVRDSSTGACPRMRCLYHCDRIVPLGRWAPLVRDAVVDAFRQRAREILSFQCGRCHTRRAFGTLAPREDGTGAWTTAMQALDLAKGVTVAELRSRIRRYADGEVSHETAYAKLCNAIPALDIAERFTNAKALSNGAIKGAQAALDLCLEEVGDPERQASLWLLHLRKVPQFFTRCCAVEHCFACRQRTFHHTSTCAENQEKQRRCADVVHIVTCPGCKVQLVKGDGCDSVSCPCGTSFIWTARVKQMLALREGEREAAMDAFRRAFAAQPQAAEGSDLCPNAGFEAALHREAVNVLMRYEGSANRNRDVFDWTGWKSASVHQRIVGAEKLSRTFPDEFRAAMSCTHVARGRALGLATEEGLAAAATDASREEEGRFSLSAASRAWTQDHPAAVRTMHSRRCRFAAVEAERLRGVAEPRMPTDDFAHIFERLYGSQRSACRAAVAIVHVAASWRDVKAVAIASPVQPTALRLLSPQTLHAWARGFAKQAAAMDALAELRGAAWDFMATHQAVRPFLDIFAAQKRESRDIGAHRALLALAGREAFLRNALLADHGWLAHATCAAGEAMARLWAFTENLRSAEGDAVGVKFGVDTEMIAEALDTAYTTSTGGLQASVESQWASHYHRALRAANQWPKHRGSRKATRKPRVPVAPLDPNVVHAGREHGKEATHAEPPHELCVPSDALARACMLGDIERDELSEARYGLVERWALHKGFDDVIDLYAELNAETEERFLGRLSFFFDDVDSAEGEDDGVHQGL